MTPNVISLMTVKPLFTVAVQRIPIIFSPMTTQRHIKAIHFSVHTCFVAITSHDAKITRFTYSPKMIARIAADIGFPTKIVVQENKNEESGP